MKRILAITIALHVMLHGIFGCCGHVFARHADACCAGHSHLPKVVPAHACDENDHHHHAAVEHEHATLEHDCDGSHDGERTPAGHHECRHDACNWLAPDAAAADGMQELHSTPTFMVLNPATLDAAVLAQRSVEHDVGPSFALPLRLHLTLGVLLI